MALCGTQIITLTHLTPCPKKTGDTDLVEEQGEAMANNTEKVELVDKLMDIKKKQQELDEAKKDFFSETVSKIDVGKEGGSDANKEQQSLAESNALKVNQQEIQQLIKLPVTQDQLGNFTGQIASVGTTPLSVSHSEVEKNQVNGTFENGTVHVSTDDKTKEKKIHIILDVKNEQPTQNVQ